MIRRGRASAALVAGATALVAIAVVVAAELRGEQEPPVRAQVGIQAGADLSYDPRVTAELGARLARVEFDISTPVAEIAPVVAAYADAGVRVLLLAGFAGRIPSRGESRNLARWAREFGEGGEFWDDRADGYLAVRHIEFGNETSYPRLGTEDRGDDYARSLRDAHRAVTAPEGNAEVGLLAQADDAGIGPRWVDAMFDAVPDLGRRVAGWTVHPYGPDYEERIARLVHQTAARGAPDDVPIYVTEWGLATDDGRCLTPDNYGWDRCMTYEEAAGVLRSVISRLNARFGRRLEAFVIYQGRDQRPSGASDSREHYFGALTSDEERKDPYTAEVEGLLRVRR